MLCSCVVVGPALARATPVSHLSTDFPSSTTSIYALLLQFLFHHGVARWVIAHLARSRSAYTMKSVLQLTDDFPSGIPLISIPSCSLSNASSSSQDTGYLSFLVPGPALPQWAFGTYCSSSVH
ncbi:hypothetical protein VTK56DRAFT_1505 [Thermocarpiscus australiensis]